MTALVGVIAFVLGLLIGVVLRDAIDLVRADQKERNVTSSPGRRTPRRMPVRFRQLAILGFIAVLAANAVTGALLIVTRANAADYTACTARWQQDFSRSYQARLDARVKVDQEIDRIVEAVDVGDMPGLTRAVNRYVELRESQERERIKNPLPPLPETLCGRPAR